MKSITAIGAAVALVAGLAMPLSALAYYPYTYFTGQNYFMGQGGFNVPQNYYGSSNCNAYYGCGTIGYNAMTGQWTQGGSSMGGYGNYGYGTMPKGYYPDMGYGVGGAYAGGGIGSYNQNSYNQNQYGYGSGCNAYVPNNVCGVIGQYSQYLPGSYGNNYGYGNSGYIY